MTGEEDELAFVSDAVGNPVRVSDVVQIDPESKLQREGFFAGCFLLVTELKSFGVMGFVAMPGKRGEMPGCAYYRVASADFVRIGTAAWEPG